MRTKDVAMIFINNLPQASICRKLIQTDMIIIDQFIKCSVANSLTQKVIKILRQP